MAKWSWQLAKGPNLNPGEGNLRPQVVKNSKKIIRKIIPVRQNTLLQKRSMFSEQSSNPGMGLTQVCQVVPILSEKIRI